MKRILLFSAALVLVAFTRPAQALDTTLYGHVAVNRQNWYPWHGPYAHRAWGAPVALVVPPTAGMTTEWRWGVSGTRIVPIYHQFGRPYPGPGQVGGAGFRPTPAWPSDTTQFGVNYVRGPWR